MILASFCAALHCCRAASSYICFDLIMIPSPSLL